MTILQCYKKHQQLFQVMRSSIYHSNGKRHILSVLVNHTLVQSIIVTSINGSNMIFRSLPKSSRIIMFHQLEQNWEAGFLSRCQIVFGSRVITCDPKTVGECETTKTYLPFLNLFLTMSVTVKVSHSESFGPPFHTDFRFHKGFFREALKVRIAAACLTVFFHKTHLCILIIRIWYFKIVISHNSNRTFGNGWYNWLFWSWLSGFYYFSINEQPYIVIKDGSLLAARVGSISTG